MKRYGKKVISCAQALDLDLKLEETSNKVNNKIYKNKRKDNRK